MTSSNTENRRAISGCEDEGNRFQRHPKGRKSRRETDCYKAAAIQSSPRPPSQAGAHHLLSGGALTAALEPVELMGVCEVRSSRPGRGGRSRQAGHLSSSCLLPAGRSHPEPGWHGALQNTTSRLPPPPGKPRPTHGGGGGWGWSGAADAYQLFPLLRRALPSSLPKELLISLQNPAPRRPPL